MEQKDCKAEFFQKRKDITHRKKWFSHFMVNLILLVLGLVTSFSGLIIQVHYHVTHHSDASMVLWGDRSRWNSIHTWISIVFLIAVIYHVRAHRKWYQNTFKQQRSSKSKPTLLLTCLTIATTVSGLIPLFMSFFDASSGLRSSMIEIHDKIGILFLVIVFFHTLKRVKWYAAVLKNKF